MSNGYICYYKDDQIEVRADTSYNAQTAAFNILRGKYPRRKIKAHEITPVLAERESGEVVTHSTAGL